MKDPRNWLMAFFAFMAGFTLLTAVRATFGAVPNVFVASLERSVGMQPGATRVLPECQCTVRYMGTSVSGNHYAVHIDKLD